MNIFIYTVIILLFCMPINLFSQKTSLIEDELIISLNENLINLNAEKALFTLQDIKSGEIIKSPKLNAYMGKKWSFKHEIASFS